MLKDIVLDVAKNIGSLGVFDEILVEQEELSSKFISYLAGNELTVLANTKNKISELTEELTGLSNLGFFCGLSNLYQNEDSTIITKTDKESKVNGLLFANKDGNKDEFRLSPAGFMRTKPRTFKGTSWNVSVAPATNKVSEFSARAALYSNIHPNIIISTENNKLMFTFGSDEGGGHSGKFIFADTTQVLKRSVTVPIQYLLLALKTASQGKSTMSIGENVVKVEFDSGLLDYQYFVMASTS